MDEVFIKINGKRQYLQLAVYQDGDVVDILIQSLRDKGAVLRFFRKMLKRQGTPGKIVTDKLRSYSAAARKGVMPSVIHDQDRYANNRTEGSHQHTRQQECQMRRFKSLGQTQRFLSIYSQVHNLFRVGHHLLKAHHYRIFVHARFIHGCS